MSDSELSDAPIQKLPSAGAMEAALRKEAAKQFDDVGKSINTIRQGAEIFLGLEAGYFKEHKTWKGKSKGIILNEIDIQTNLPEPSSHTVSANYTPARPKSSKPEPKAVPKKRPSPAAEKPPKKRQKKSAPREESEGDLSSPPAEESKTKSGPRAKKPKAVAKKKEKPPSKSAKDSQTHSKPEVKKAESDRELSDVPADDPKDEHSLDKPTEDSGSEISVLIDEEVAPKKKGQSKDSSKPKKTAKPKPAADDDPDQEEIKRLQGWLVKCGIRKIWAFELKPYETSKAKIRHLKEMLGDIGMTGRYSLEKASQIKEARELAADIEAVQEGNEIWGKDGKERSKRSKRSDYVEPEDEEDADSGPKRKLVRGPKRFDFLSSDGEESD